MLQSDKFGLANISRCFFGIRLLSLAFPGPKFSWGSEIQTHTEAPLRGKNSQHSSSSNKMISAAVLTGVAIKFNIQESMKKRIHELLSYSQVSI